jgi:hypothetical protein
VTAPAKSPFATRLMIAHMIAYPVAFVWAAAAIVPALTTLSTDALALPADQIADKVLWRVGAAGLVVFALAHLTALPWARARDDAARTPAGKRVYVAATSALGGAGVLAAVASWAWLLSRAP